MTHSQEVFRVLELVGQQSSGLLSHGISLKDERVMEGGSAIV